MEAVDPRALADAMQRALAACRQGDWPGAERICNAVLSQAPDDFDAMHVGGLAAAQLGRHDDAVERLTRALAIRPHHAETRVHLGAVLAMAGRHDDALASYDHALREVPDFLPALRSRADLLLEIGRTADALLAYDAAIAHAPGDAALHVNRGVALDRAQRADEALASHDRAIALEPSNADAHFNRANTLRAMHRDEDAVASYDAAIALRPAFTQALQNRGVALSQLARYGEAIASFERALAIDPSYANAWINRANAMRAQDRDDEALESYARAMAIDPAAEFLRGAWLHARMTVCDWQGIDDAFAELERRIANGERASPPFPALAISSSPSVLHTVARTWVEARYPERHDLPSLVGSKPGPKIRIGYVAATLHEHATAYLMAQLFESHDRGAFEITAFSFGPQTGDPMRVRIAAAFDRFVEIGALSDPEAAMLARSLGIDIAVDLMGYTRDGRPGIFACRAAPIQVAYLGYPGTMGAPYIDYAIVDRVVVPESQRDHYSEKLVYMPSCYQVNDAQRPRPQSAITREQAGLPGDGFVYCCFNNNFKLTPRTFDAWMRILRNVERSVLWLMEDNPWAAANLRNEARARGVDPARLVFARRVPLMEHLARHRLADLFLDTLPYNAHTTASDALWMGLPVLTCAGEAFAGRVAASLLGAVGMQDLVVATLEEYEARAVELARDDRALANLRTTLASRLSDAPLFDAGGFARDLERAYSAMHARARAGLRPDHLDMG